MERRGVKSSHLGTPAGRSWVELGNLAETWRHSIMELYPDRKWTRVTKRREQDQKAKRNGP
jgi:hypothetical protein